MYRLYIEREREEKYSFVVSSGQHRYVELHENFCIH